MQSACWCAFKKREGYEVTRLVYEVDSLRKGFAAILRYPFAGEAGFVLCPEGPVLPWEEFETTRDALRALTGLVREIPGSIGLRIEPHLPRPVPKVLRNWSDAPTDLTPSDTLLLDLSLCDDQILAQVAPKCRYNLRIADRHGIVVSSTKDMDVVHEFYDLLRDTSDRTGFFIEPFGFFINLFTTLFAAESAELLISRYQGKMLAAILVVYFGRRATYLYGASSSVDRHTMPVYPLHLAAIQEARKRGCVEYDLYGIDAAGRRDHLYAGITRFKRQWGGREERRIGARDYVFYDRVADLVIERLSHDDILESRLPNG